ncbi:cytochrome c1 [Acetobacter farinalis]|uniref:Cytochrome c1 n=1 Tax=Acetobacter farinalis TaxID=1260984 RepID=A0ABT3Q9W8_9PROT|nr:cytochrome c1 [Acetobacter farinalis]MCX2562065.1 cytochrome c1 [Acetobacter farinalis]NHO30669.1 cytochrome c1 [Acetobacter farinalis]
MVRLSFTPALALLLSLPLTVRAAPPATEPEKAAPPHQTWSFDGPLGQFDQKSLQRGFTVYSQVCSACHGMRSVTYNDLSGIGLSRQALTDLAHAKQVPGPPDSMGQPTMRPGLPDDHLRSPFPNEAAAAAMMGGVAPPDQSRLAAIHPHGADWLYAFLTGYHMPPPPGAPVVPGKFYNDWADGHLVGMPPPLMNGAVQFADGTPATVAQQARDVTTFLVWASDPHRTTRHRVGLYVFAYLSGLLVLAIAWKRKIWNRAKTRTTQDADD